ncbi:MAG TPA: hypothetical protein VLH16_02150, partial [Bacteroidales bacterium]|nr:hypothetical protein [Bacteroidales bacterium]
KESISPEWVDNVLLLKNILIRGKEASEQINILGDDGVPIDYHFTYWKAETFDAVILQQDAFDKIDRNSSMERQKYMLDKVFEVYHAQFNFDSFEDINPYFKRIINQLKQMNFSEYQSENFFANEKELHNIIEERKVK